MAMFSFFNRDLSWLSFNERVLMEAMNESVPLFERIKFLSIYSSNLDEFYRVRMPALMALHQIERKTEQPDEALDQSRVLQQIKTTIQHQQERFGKTLTQHILPGLKGNDIHLLYNEPLQDLVIPFAREYFFTQVLAFLQPVYLSDHTTRFFPENNKLYLIAIVTHKGGKEDYVVVNVPTDNLPRFYSVKPAGVQYIAFIEDIIRSNLDLLFKDASVTGCYSFKITRDAELDLEDEYTGDMAEAIEKQIEKRDLGLATRFLYQPGIPLRCLQTLVNTLGLFGAAHVEGGAYHNLKDLSSLPITNPALSYEKWPPVVYKAERESISLLDKIMERDLILHVPYQSYDPILRFFNEASADPGVKEIYVTLYRVASESRIVNALISAAKNGKKVTVFIELKARFDEANNIRWAKRMKTAGVKIIYPIPGLKVHAKIALVKREQQNRMQYFGLLATGNLNETTAKFYTDHILLTSQPDLLREMELLFIFLTRRKKPSSPDLIRFSHLLVAQFNLQARFLELIEREMNYARQGLPAHIILKLNNLEEKVLISKLYEASNAGVKISLIVRSVCCIIPGVPGISKNISVIRIVDRYLEHGRIFIFHNLGNEELWLGSADWMNRNIYRRIEVCFPVYDKEIRTALTGIIQLQLKDNVQAVAIDSSLNNLPVETDGQPVQSQEAIYKIIAHHA
jgi:polyphosphate kinase